MTFLAGVIVTSLRVAFDVLARYIDSLLGGNVRNDAGAGLVPKKRIRDLNAVRQSDYVRNRSIFIRKAQLI